MTTIEPTTPCTKQGCGAPAERRVVLRLGDTARDHRLCVPCATSLVAYAVRQGIQAGVDILDGTEPPVISPSSLLATARRNGAVVHGARSIGRRSG